MSATYGKLFVVSICVFAGLAWPNSSLADANLFDWRAAEPFCTSEWLPFNAPQLWQHDGDADNFPDREDDLFFGYAEGISGINGTTVSLARFLELDVGCNWNSPNSFPAGAEVNSVEINDQPPDGIPRVYDFDLGGNTWQVNDRFKVATPANVYGISPFGHYGQHDTYGQIGYPDRSIPSSSLLSVNELWIQDQLTVTNHANVTADRVYFFGDASALEVSQGSQFVTTQNSTPTFSHARIDVLGGSTLALDSLGINQLYDTVVHVDASTVTKRSDPQEGIFWDLIVTGSTFSLQNQSTLSAPALWPERNSTVNIDNSDAVVGFLYSAGNLTIENGANVFVARGLYKPNVHGIFAVRDGTTVIDNASLYSEQQLQLGGTDGNYAYGSPTLRVIGGGHLLTSKGESPTDSSGIIGQGDSTNPNTAIMEIEGSGSRWEQDGTIQLGFAAVGDAGMLDISNGGFVNAKNANLGRAVGAAGIINVTDSVLEIDRDLTVGLAGDGQLTVSQGATVVADTLYLAREASASGQLIATGGKIQADVAQFGAGMGSVSLGAEAELLVAEQLDLGTDGELTLANGMAIVGNGPDNTLPSTLRIHPDGTLAGSGQIDGALTTAGTVQLQLTDETTFDQLTFTQSADMSGLLELELGAAFAPEIGTEFLILSAVGGLNGMFSTVDGVEAGPDLSLAVVYDENEVRAIAALPGDANVDGSVDGADFNIWKNFKFTRETSWSSGDFNGDGLTDGRDLLIWNSHKFLSVDSTTIPEPGAGWLCAIAAAMVVAQWRS